MPKIQGYERQIGLVAGQTGARVDTAAFAGPGEAMSGLGEMMTQFAAKVRTREDAVARAGDFSRFNEGAQSELLRLQTEADLADLTTFQGYRSRLEEQMQEIVGNHAGSDDSRAQLLTRLEGVRSTMVQQAAHMSAVAGQKRVLTVLGGKLSSLTRKVTEEPGSINDMFRVLDDEIDDMAAAMTPEQETEFRMSARREITLSAINSLVDRPGGMDEAAELVRNPGLIEMMTPEQQRGLQRKFAEAEALRTQASREARDVLIKAETILGRRPTATERMRLSGLGGSGEATALDKINGIESALGRPLSRDERARALGVQPQSAQTAAGKAVQDREMFVSQYGPDSPQVAAFDGAAAAEANGVKMSDVSGMRKEFTMLSKDYVGVRDAFGRIEAGSRDPSPAGDIAMVYNFMKMLDPGSTVMSGEYATAQNAAGVPERVRTQFNKLASGERLGEAQRADFLGQAQNLLAAQTRQQRQLEGQYRGIAERQGIPYQDVIVDFVASSGVEADPANATAPAAGKKPVRAMPKVGHEMDGWRFKGGDPSKKENWESVNG